MPSFSRLSRSFALPCSAQQGLRPPVFGSAGASPSRLPLVPMVQQQKPAALTSERSVRSIGSQVRQADDPELI